MNNVLSILSYIKTLDNYGKYHPIICVGCHEIFEEYFDYYIVDNLLYIVGITITDIGSGGYKTISVVNPKAITNIYCDDALQADFSSIALTENVTDVDFKALAKTFLQKCISNPNNFDLPYTKVRLLVGDESIRLSEDITLGENIFSIDINELNLGKIVGNPGSPMYGKYRVFTEYDKIQVITVPFSEVFMSPFKDIVGSDILALSDQYRMNHFGVMGVPNYKHQEYAKGDRVWLDVTIKHKDGTVDPEVRKWFVSKVHKNSDIPLSKEAREHDSWLEFNPNAQPEETEEQPADEDPKQANNG